MWVEIDKNVWTCKFLLVEIQVAELYSVFITGILTSGWP